MANTHNNQNSGAPNGSHPKSTTYDSNMLANYLEVLKIQTCLIVAGTTALLGADNHGFVEEFIERANPNNSALELLDILVLIGSKNDMNNLMLRIDQKYGIDVFQPGICKVQGRAILLVIGANGQGQGKSITGIFQETRLEDYISKIVPTFSNTINILNLVGIPMKIQGLITSNGMTGFSTELAMFFYNSLPKQFLSSEFIIYLIDEINLDSQSYTQKLDLGFKNYIRVALKSYKGVQLKFIPLVNPQGGINYSPFSVILYNLRTLQMIAQPERFHSSLICVNDIADLKQFGRDSELIYRSRNPDLQGAVWHNISSTQLSQAILKGYFKGTYEDEMKQTVQTHIQGLNQFLLKEQINLDSKLLSNLIYNIHSILLVPFGFRTMIPDSQFTQLKALLLKEIRLLLDTPFVSISIIEFSIKTPLLMTEVRVFPAVVISEYLNNSSLHTFHNTINDYTTKGTSIHNGVHPLKRLATTYLQLAKDKAKKVEKYLNIAEALETMNDTFVEPIYSAGTKRKNNLQPKQSIQPGNQQGNKGNNTVSSTKP
jgi:hypothetical protein